MSEYRKPVKPWRVQRRGDLFEEYRSWRAAYDAVSALTSEGFEVAVWHWEDGDWCLWERIGAQS